MTLVLHEHPFASYCQKVLIALYELDLPFDTHLIETEQDRAELAELWPVGSIPVLTEDSSGLALPESTTIVEYLDGLSDGGPTLIPDDGGSALQARLWDRFFDQQLATPMQKIVGDRLRAEGREDPEGVEEARAALDTAYGLLDAHMADRRWALGDAFGLADCAAAPPLFYLWAVHRWDRDGHPNVTGYFAELMARPSVARVVEEARPYREVFPHPWPDDVDEFTPAG